MSNRRKTKADKLAQRLGRCPRCKGYDRSSKEYDDAWLHICRRCKYPVREVKS